jgi:hypothetical protein
MRTKLFVFAAITFLPFLTCNGLAQPQTPSSPPPSEQKWQINPSVELYGFGTCTYPLKEGDICSQGICYAGSRRVARCAKRTMKCVIDGYVKCH